MKNTIRFAVMALFVAAVMMSCDKKENFDCCTLRVTEVTEHTISGRCEYAPTKADKGYMLFLAYTDQLDDSARMAMVDAYKEYGGIKESKSFKCEDLISNTKYYILAVTFSEKKGKVEVASVQSLAQATLADNDNRVTMSMVSATSATFNVAVADSSYTVEKFLVFETEGYAKISAEVSFSVSDTAAESIEGDNCYDSDRDKMVCKFVYNTASENGTTNQYYGYKMNADSTTYTKYKSEITVYNELNRSGMTGVGMYAQFACFLVTIGVIY